MPKTYSESRYGKLEYGFYIPEKYDKTKSYPLVMFLHGWSANQHAGKTSLLCIYAENPNYLG